MNHNGQSRVLNNIVSPYGLAMVSYGLFLCAWLLPPSIYSHAMSEPDLMFLDPAAMLFYSMCVASFMAGVWLVGWIAPAAFVDTQLKARVSPTLFLLLPLLLGTAGTVVAMYVLFKQVPNILILLLAQQGADLKDTLALDVEGNIGFAPLALTAAAWWVFWRASELGIQGWRKRLVTIALTIAVICVIAASTIMLVRDQLMMILCGLIVLFFARMIVRKQLTPAKFLRLGTVFVVCVSLLFMTFSFLRGTDGWNEQLRSLMGYTIASYNRLAAIVNGQMRYPLAGRGVYLSYVAAYGHALNLVVPIGKVIDPPQFLDLWASEFGAVSRAGLDGTLIWSGAFGYIFSELGWFSCLFVFGYGILNGLAWRWLKLGMAPGLVLYPYCAFCTLTWFATNSLLGFTAETFGLLAVAIAAYEWLFLKRSAPVAIP